MISNSIRLCNGFSHSLRTTGDEVTGDKVIFVGLLVLTLGCDDGLADGLFELDIEGCKDKSTSVGRFDGSRVFADGEKDGIEDGDLESTIAGANDTSSTEGPEEGDTDCSDDDVDGR